MVVQIPQFIETEDKIIGPLTLKQFGFIAAAFLISLGFFYIFELWLSIVFAMTLGAIAIALAFAHVNGKPLYVFFVSAVIFYWRPRVFLWQHTAPSLENTAKISSVIKDIKDLPQLKTAPQPEVISSVKPRIAKTTITSSSNLNSLSEKLMTTKNVIPKREKVSNRLGSRDRFAVLEKFTGERMSAKRVDFR